MDRQKVSAPLAQLVAVLLLWPGANAQYDINRKIPAKVPHDQFVRFVTRPDIEVPKWDVTVYDKAQISPGYWFAAPYEQIGMDPPNPAWVGPQIWDNNGELVWSSTDMFESANTFDFRVVEVQGKSWMTVISTYAEVATLLDEHYDIQQRIPLGKRGKTVNMHDFNMIDNGTRALIPHRNITNPPEQLIREIGVTGSCRVISQGFELRDTTRSGWNSLFQWNSLDHIHLNESTLRDGKCRGIWDFLHTNSVDKCPDGNYVLSGRHTDTIYKISKDDGAIIWRLGGKQSDFNSDFRFSRQHHIRCRSQNETHTVVSFLDNAKGGDSNPATHKYSRGLLVALENSPAPGKQMKATMIAEYPHPTKQHNDGRGSCEVLPNGNVWMGWSDRALQSEHLADGRMVMKAVLVPEWLRSYRTYKFNFVGLPTRLPDVVAIAGNAKTGTQTDIHVSWNGATEVAFWNFYKSDSTGETRHLIATSPRLGFETHVTYAGYASYVYVEAIDSAGESLQNGRSNVLKTSVDGRLDKVAVANESDWLQEAAYVNEHPWAQAASDAGVGPSIAMFTAGVVVVIVVVLLIWLGKNAPPPQKYPTWRDRTDYQPVDGGDAELGDDDDKGTYEMSGSPRTTDKLFDRDDVEEDVPVEMRQSEENDPVR